MVWHEFFSCMQSEYIPIWHPEYTCTFWLCVCLCFYVWLGGVAYGLVPAMYCDFNIWMGSGHLCMTLVSCLCWFGAIRWRKVVRRGRYLGFLRVWRLLLFPTASRWLLLYCTVRVDDPMHARILFFSVYWVWYYTYVVHHYLFIVSVCCMLLCPVVLNFAIVICSAHSLQLYSVSCWTSLSGVSSCYILHFSICRCMCYVYVSMCSWLR